MKKLLGILIFLGFLWLLYSTCPNENDHVEALSEVIPEFINDKLGEIGLDSELRNDPRVQEFINILGPSLVDVNDYLIFSVAKEKLSGENNVVSFGILGHVYTFNDEIVKKAQTIAGDLETKIKEIEIKR